MTTKPVYENHMVTKHGAAKEGPVSDYKCQKCQKVFTGKHLLSNHLHRGTCNLPKKFHAHFATGTLKTKAYLVSVHMKQQHIETMLKFTCQKCKKSVSSK